MTQQAQTIAEALNTDPVYVTNAAKGEINETLLQKAETKIDSLDFDVYVIITGGEGADRDLLEQVKVFNGDEGAFIMIDTNTDLAVDYTFEDQHDLQMQVMEQMSVGREQWSHSTPSQTKLNMLLDLYADPQEAPEYETGQEVSGSEVQTVDGSNSTATLFLGERFWCWRWSSPSSGSPGPGESGRKPPAPAAASNCRHDCSTESMTCSGRPCGTD